jgi:hypothetical protein
MLCKKIHPRLARGLDAAKWAVLIEANTIIGNFPTGSSSVAWIEDAAIAKNRVGLTLQSVWTTMRLGVFFAFGCRWRGGAGVPTCCSLSGSVSMKNLVMAGCCLFLATSLLSAQELGEVSVGAKAPDFTVIGIDGMPLRLSELTAKGKRVVLLFDRAHW